MQMEANMAEHHLVFVGTYTEPIKFGTGKVLEGKGKGIYVFKWDSTRGILNPSCVNTGIANPSYLAIDKHGRFLYAVNELKQFEGLASGSLSAFEIIDEEGHLRFLNSCPTKGTDPCHVALDPRGRHAVVANFMSGSVAVFSINPNGSLDRMTDFVQHQGSSIDAGRQSGPHAHSAVFDPSCKYLLIPDLGIDKLVAYEFDDAKGSIVERREKTIRLPAGSGPRYMEFHPSGAYAYVINELNSTVTALKVQSEGQWLAPIQTISTLPSEFKGESTCAHLQIEPTGRYLYASNRGHDSIAIFSINTSNGCLEHVGWVSSGGRTPRHFCIDPSGKYLLAANQDSDNIAVYRIDYQSGKLEATGQQVSVPAPVCIKCI